VQTIPVQLVKNPLVVGGKKRAVTQK